MTVPSGPDAQGVTAGRFQAVVRVLVFVRSDDCVLLLRGAANKPIWPGLLNGIGGHVEANEDPLSAAQREVREECGLDLPPSALRLAAVISIDVGQARTGVLLLVFVAIVDEPRELTSSTEGSLEWHPIGKLDGLPLVEDLPWLLPRIWGSGVVFARYSYGASGLEISPEDGARSRGT